MRGLPGGIGVVDLERVGVRGVSKADPEADLVIRRVFTSVESGALYFLTVGLTVGLEARSTVGKRIKDSVEGTASEGRLD